MLSCNCLQKILRFPVRAVLLKPYVRVHKLLVAADGLLATSTLFFAVFSCPAAAFLYSLLLFIWISDIVFFYLSLGSHEIKLRCVLVIQKWLLKQQLLAYSAFSFLKNNTGSISQKHWGIMFLSTGVFSSTVWYWIHNFLIFLLLTVCLLFPNICFHIICWLPVLSSHMLISFSQVSHFSGFVRLWLHPSPLFLHFVHLLFSCFSFATAFLLTLCREESFYCTVPITPVKREVEELDTIEEVSRVARLDMHGLPCQNIRGCCFQVP